MYVAFQRSYINCFLVYVYLPEKLCSAGPDVTKIFQGINRLHKPIRCDSLFPRVVSGEFPSR